MTTNGELTAERVAGVRGVRRAPLPGRARSERVTVRVTSAERARLAARAEMVGTSVAGLLLEAGLEATAGGRLVSGREAAGELLKLRRLLANLAGNMNQIAAKANAAAGVDTARLVGVLDATADAVERVTVAAGDVVAGR